MKHREDSKSKNERERVMGSLGCSPRTIFEPYFPNSRCENNHLVFHTSYLKATLQCIDFVSSFNAFWTSQEEQPRTSGDSKIVTNGTLGAVMLSFACDQGVIMPIFS